MEPFGEGFAWTFSFNESSADPCFSIIDRTCAASVSGSILKKESKCHKGLALSIEISHYFMLLPSLFLDVSTVHSRATSTHEPPRKPSDIFFFCFVLVCYIA